MIVNPVILEVKKLSLGEEEWEDVCVKGTPVLSLYLGPDFGASRAKHVGGTPVLWMWARVKPNLADVLASEVLVVASQLIPLWPREDGKLRNGKYLEGGFMFSSWETDFPCSGWIAPLT